MPRPGNTTVSHDEGAADEETLEEQYDVRDPSEQQEPETEEANTPDADATDSGKGEGAEEVGDIPEDLLDRAQDAGLTEQEARAFNPDRLDAVVTRMELAQAPSQDGGEPEQGGPDETEGSEESDEDEPFHEIGLDESVYDPEIVDELRSMRDDFQEELDRRTAQARSQGGSVNHEQGEGATMQDVEKPVLEAIEGLPDEYAEEFGTEPLDQVDDPDTLEKRERLLAEMDDFAQLYEQKGQEPPEIEDLVRKAANSAFPDIASEAQANEARQKAAQRRRTARPGPASKGSDQKSPEDEALNFVENFMKDHGQETTTMETNREDFPEGSGPEHRRPGAAAEADHTPEEGTRELGF